MTLPQLPLILAQADDLVAQALAGLNEQLGSLGVADFVTFIGYVIVLLTIGAIAGRKKKEDAEDYFLAGRSLPWYVVGSSYIAANISTDHFIGMVGAAYVYGIMVATPEWSSVIAFTFLIWIFIPFMLSAKVFTAPQFLEQRFNRGVRDAFAMLTIFMNVVVVMGAVLYGGALALQAMLETTLAEPIPFVVTVLIISVVSGGIAVYGGLKSVAWMDLFTVIVMVAGGLMVSILGLRLLGEQAGSEGFFNQVTDGAVVMIEKNQANDGMHKEAVDKHVDSIKVGSEEGDDYNRLSVLQPITHVFTPWTHWVFSFFYIGIWYLAINQFMVQRLFAAKDMYHARMGIVFAGFLKLLLPFIVVIPGLILFAYYPNILNIDEWGSISGEADKTYPRMIQLAVPAGLAGILLAALFGAIQSTISAVLNATSTVFTVDVYQRFFDQNAEQGKLVVVGRLSSVAFLVIAFFVALLFAQATGGLFFIVQMAYSLLAPPFAAVFLLGSLWRRINGEAALGTIISGFVFAGAIQLYAHPAFMPKWFGYEPTYYLTTFPIQALSTWGFCMILCTVWSLLTPPPRPEQVTDELTFNLKSLHLTKGLGKHWYSSVTFWWIISVILMFALIYVFGILL